jgi:2-oxoglutarate ferredoxin oxidoreductase subunit alpha
MATHEHPRVGKSARTASQRGAVQELGSATIRFAGDAADAIQLIGAQFTNAATEHGNYVGTELDPSAEIRAPAGTLAGVTAFQVHISKCRIALSGELLHALFALNPAALKVNLADVRPGGIVLVDSDAFSPFECQKAGYADDPLEDGTLKPYRLLAMPINQLNRDAVAKLKLSPREAERC